MKNNPDSLAKVGVIKETLANMLRTYIFEPNNDETWKQVTEDYVEFLAKQGFNDFEVKCDGENNTQLRIEAFEFWVDLYIQVNEGETFIHIPLCLSPAPTNG